MNRLKLNVARMSSRALIAQADLSIGQLAPEPPTEPPVPDMEENVARLVEARDAAFTADKDYEDAKKSLVVLKEARDAATRALRTEHRSMIRTLEGKTRGDLVPLVSTAYPVAKVRSRTGERPTQVTGFRLRVGESDGSIRGRHRAAERADIYEVQVTPGDPIEGPYETKLHSTATSWELTDLPSAARVWVRVRGHGPNGAGPWSNPVRKTVP